MARLMSFFSLREALFALFATVAVVRWFFLLLAGLKLVQERGRNVRRAKAFFEQALDQVVLAFEFAAGKNRPKLVEDHVGARFLHSPWVGGLARWIFVRVNRSMCWIWNTSRPATNEIARPLRPARPVRPMRCR